MNCLNDPYHRHQFIWKAFSQLDSRQFLFKYTEEREGHMFIILSDITPSKIDDFNVETISIPEKMFNWSKYLFNVEAAPCIKKYNDGKPTRIPIIKEEDKKDWILRKLKPQEVTITSITKNTDSVFMKNEVENGIISTAVFVGVLEVKDRESLINVFRNGIGPYKSFGYGMITLKAIK